MRVILDFLSTTTALRMFAFGLLGYLGATFYEEGYLQEAYMMAIVFVALLILQVYQALDTRSDIHLDRLKKELQQNTNERVLSMLEGYRQLIETTMVCSITTLNHVSDTLKMLESLKEAGHPLTEEQEQLRIQLGTSAADTYQITVNLKQAYEAAFLSPSVRSDP